MLPNNDNTNVGLLPSPIPRQAPVRWEHILPLLTRLLVWGIILGLLTLLSSFFALIFLTFVFAYLQSGIVDVLTRRMRWLRVPVVVLVGGLFLGAIITVSLFLAPKVYQQATGFAKGFFVYMETIDTEVLNLAERYPLLQEAIPELRRPPAPVQPSSGIPEWAAPVAPVQNGVAVTGGVVEQPAIQRTFSESPTGLLVGLLTGKEKSVDSREAVKVALDQLTNLSRQALAILTTFLLALLFAFLIVLDLPHLAASVRDLENTRLRFIYVEVADNIYQFGKVLGHAMQAQFYIACVNTVLTAIGLHVLGMGEHMAFLSVLVFLFSFVPVAGVFISSVPICLIALNMGGVNLMLLGVAMITIIHLIEGYILNPLIYGARLRVNPVIVLIILTVGGKLFHIWGLILGLPVCIYLFGHAIRYRKSPFS
ncbi:AI-2E family transporter [Thiothrix subterranea]|uniref:AI-2E family transporter n=1 Tax=Thiothrix subterranea TaxID=2735563 RepID=A0AA51MMG1_9GAMM|nr:AI-2E family transporter [Thiothrix subterranea]MDQ5767873.1 AI-2E family transporter [Thiothrix subterranea]QQZ28146.1 AI-2E family transporter [Thiothrix subterranea]WML86668.1 AI-2E family transporter [Thiothrix subterranea]